MLPPLQFMPPEVSTVMGDAPSSEPPEIVSVPGCQGPGPVKITVAPEMTSAFPLTVVVPPNVAVPELNVQVPPRFNPTGMVMVDPATVKLPAPEIVVPPLMGKVPPPKSNVAP